MVVLNYIFFNVDRRLKYGRACFGGRNYLGRVCVQGRGGLGSKSVYRSIDFFRRVNSFGVISKIIYDSYRSAFVGLIFYANGLSSYIILSNLNKIGDTIYSGFVQENFLIKDFG